MPYSETLNFESARFLNSLYAGKDSNLQEIEKAFKVHLTCRDSWIKIQGKQESVRRVQELFHQLQDAQAHGIKIGPHEFRYTLIAVQNKETSKLSELWNTQIRVSHKKPAIAPKTFAQKAYIQSIQENDLVLGIGPAGTGKTYLAVAMACMALESKQVSRLILTRPAVEAGETLGFLPGDLKEKILPYLRPLYDALHEMLGVEAVQRFTERDIIEISPLAYMRGRTLNNAFIILDEAQNTTTEQMFMFLTRLGAGSKCVVTGDPTQVDLPPNKKSGLAEAIQALSEVPEVSIVRFEENDALRHQLVNKILLAYKEHRGARQTSML